MNYSSQIQDNHQNLPKSASFSRQLSQHRKKNKQEQTSRLYQDSLKNKLNPFGDVNNFSYLPRSTLTYSGSMSLRTHIQKQKAREISKSFDSEDINSTISDKEDEDSFQSPNQNFSTPKKVSRKSPKENLKSEKARTIPASRIAPPILCDESHINKDKPDENNANNKQENYEVDSEYEMSLRHLSNAQLQKQYRMLIQRYIDSTEKFQALMKKKEKTTHALDQLKKNVSELEAEQRIVEEEYQRLGLGTPPQPEANTNTNFNTNMSTDSILKTDDLLSDIDNSNDNNNNYNNN